jgi:hypothetical protein
MRKIGELEVEDGEKKEIEKREIWIDGEMILISPESEVAEEIYFSPGEVCWQRGKKATKKRLLRGYLQLEEEYHLSHWEISLGKEIISKSKESVNFSEGRECRGILIAISWSESTQSFGVQVFIYSQLPPSVWWFWLQE